MSKSMRVHMLNLEHLSSSEEDVRFDKLTKIAGKYKKEEEFGKFKSQFLENQSESSEDENEDEQNNNDEEEQSSDDSGSNFNQQH